MSIFLVSFFFEEEEHKIVTVVKQDMNILFTGFMRSIVFLILLLKKIRDLMQTIEKYYF